MSFVQNLVHGRSQLVFVAALLSASAIILQIDKMGGSLEKAPQAPASQPLDIISQIEIGRAHV